RRRPRLRRRPRPLLSVLFPGRTVRDPPFAPGRFPPRPQPLSPKGRGEKDGYDPSPPRGEGRTEHPASPRRRRARLALDAPAHLCHFTALSISPPRPRRVGA